MENPQNEHKLDNGSLHVGITIRCHQNKRNAKFDKYEDDHKKDRIVTTQSKQLGNEKKRKIN